MRQYGSANVTSTEDVTVKKPEKAKTEENTKTKFQKLLITLRLDPHHRMERFAISFFSLLLIAVILFGYSAKLYIDSKKIVLSSRALYTESTVWSLTGGNVNVEGIYRNEETTKVFILLKMSTDTMDKMPTDASNYEMYVTGYDERLTNDLVGAVYMFGNSGYMGLYFADAAGIDAHMYDIVVRNTNVITTDRSKDAPSRYNDESFKYHNQIRIYANLAGSSATVVNFLSTDSIDTAQMYAETVMAKRESDIKAELNDTLIDMNNTMMLINEYRNRLIAADINPDIVSTTDGTRPAIPNIIANDRITTDVELTKDNATAFDSTSTLDESVVVNNPYNITVQTEEGMDFNAYVDTNGDKKTKLYLVTNEVFPGGYQYNYQDISLTDHFLNGMIPEGMNFRQWRQSKITEMNTYPYPNRLTWGNFYYSSGEVFTYNPEQMYDATSQQIQADITRYENAIEELYELKYKYQTELLYNYLAAASDMETTNGIFTVNAEKTALTMY